MKFFQDDGGRVAAGFKGKAGDCAVRAVAIATGKSYSEVYVELAEVMQQSRCHRQRGETTPRDGVFTPILRKYLFGLGATWTPTMTIGSGCKVHLKEGELPSGRLICNLSKHVVAVIDGVIHDTYDPSRNGTRCVYGYWRFE